MLSSIVLRAALLVALLLASGCVGGTPAGPAGNTSVRPAPEPSAGADQGSITGTLTDEELTPLSKANVLLLPSKAQAETDASGAFTFNEVAPGEHTLFASRVGYKDAQKRVTVEAGGVSTVSLVLQSVTIGENYHAVYPGVFYVVFGISDFHRATALRDITCQPCELWIRHPGATTDALFEALWTKSMPVPALNEKFSFSVRANAANNSIIATGTAAWTGVLTSGQGHRFDQDQSATLATSKLTMLLANVPSDTPAFNQRVNIWFSIAWNGMLPDNHTAMPPR